MGIRLRPLPKFQFLTDAGAPGDGYKVHAYQPGTTTRKDTYTTYTGGAANDNPVILNARGEADIWFNGIYKLVITDADDVEVYTVDNYGEGEDSVITGNYNKAKNGGLETDTAGDGLPDDWSITEYDATSTVLIDATDQIEGLNSLKFTSTGLGGGYADSDFMEVREGRTLTAIFAIKSSVVDVRNVVDILWYTAAKALISTSNVYDEAAANPTSWTEKTGEITAPSTARFAKIRLIGCHSSDATNGSTWFDDVQVTDIAPATQAQVLAGTEDRRYVTPNTLAGVKSKFVNLADGSPVSHATSFDAAVIPASTWESIGPSDAGSWDNTWAALDDLPDDIDWIEVYLQAVTFVTSGGSGANVTVDIHARENGTLEAAAAKNRLGRIHGNCSTAGAFRGSESVVRKIPVASKAFDMYWAELPTSTLNNGWDILLTGYGYTP